MYLKAGIEEGWTGRYVDVQTCALLFQRSLPYISAEVRGKARGRSDRLRWFVADSDASLAKTFD